MKKKEKIERKLLKMEKVLKMIILSWAIFLVVAGILQKQILIENYGILVTIISAILLLTVFVLALIYELQNQQLNECIMELQQKEKKQLEKYVQSQYDFFEKYYIEYNIDISILKSMKHIYLIKRQDEYQLVAEDQEGQKNPIKIIQNPEELFTIFQKK